LVTEDEYKTKFNEYLDKGMDVLYIGCSSALSGSVKLGAKVAKQIMEQRPDAKIIVIDALNSGMGQGFMGIKASLLRSEGKTIDEVAAITEREKLKYNQFATVGTLTYLKNAGRVKAGAAFFGNIIGIKPIIISDVKGNNYAYKKVRGRKAALEEIAQSIVDNAIEPEKNWLAIDNADCEDDAKAIIAMVEAKGVKFARYFMNPLGPILGASCGPQTIISYFYGKEVTILGE
jgi:DegV family protein with EDD domain